MQFLTRSFAYSFSFYCCLLELYKKINISTRLFFSRGGGWPDKARLAQSAPGSQARPAPGSQTRPAQAARLLSQAATPANVCFTLDLLLRSSRSPLLPPCCSPALYVTFLQCSPSVYVLMVFVCCLFLNSDEQHALAGSAKVSECKGNDLQSRSG